jgi:undecaprenyl diphosphate synthase
VIQEKIRELEEFSKDYDELYFQIALNYGSRDEIVRGVRKLAQDVADGKCTPSEIDESLLENYLDTAGVHIIKAHEELDHGGLPRPRGADYGNPGSRRRLRPCRAL